MNDIVLVKDNIEKAIDEVKDRSPQLGQLLSDDIFERLKFEKINNPSLNRLGSLLIQHSFNQWSFSLVRLNRSHQAIDLLFSIQIDFDQKTLFDPNQKPLH